MSDYFDYVIVGGGITGLSIARELTQRQSGSSIAIIEKEQSLGLHGSGRNSGVLHSGIYYPSDSLKAQFCRKGAAALAEYCDEYGLPIDRMGKVIVTTEEEQDPQIDLLFERANKNGARVSVISDQELADIEPSAKTASGRALFSPDTSVVDPMAVLNHLRESLESKGVGFLTGSEIVQADRDSNFVTQCRWSTLGSVGADVRSRYAIHNAAFQRSIL